MQLVNFIQLLQFYELSGETSILYDKKFKDMYDGGLNQYKNWYIHNKKV